jgi:hypothetical protein
MRCLSLKLFYLTFLVISYGSDAEGLYHSFAYLDCGNGEMGTRFNVYTYTGMYHSPYMLDINAV